MSDYSDYHSPEKVQARRRAHYVRQHAHLHCTAAALIWPLAQRTTARVARAAVDLAGAVYDALPADPDEDQSGGAPTTCSDPQCPPVDPNEDPAQPEIPPPPSPRPAPLPPVEPETTTRTAAPACTCSGKQPCSAECRHCVPERRQSAGPQEATHVGRTPLAKRLRALADCQQSQDPAVVAAYHAHLASSGLQDCGACGAQLDIAVVPDCRPSTAEEAGRLVRRIASAPIHSELAVQP